MGTRAYDRRDPLTSRVEIAGRRAVTAGAGTRILAYGTENRMDVFGILLGIAVVQFLASASPGPNVILVISHAMGGARRRALLVVAGILAGTMTWAIVTASGLGVLMHQVPAIHTTLQFAAAAYLIWLGAKMLIGVLRRGPGGPAETAARALPAWQAVRAGFFTTITNPKSIAYYSSLFVVMFPADPPWWLFLAAIVTAFLASATLYISLVLFFTAAPVRRAFVRARRFIDAVLGGLLIVLGVRIALSGR
jgi:threonine efflux protein